MDYWHDLSVGDNAPQELNSIVEIPKGSRNKYEVDKETGLLKLDRVMAGSMHYPGDYGMIPQTLGEDNDPLDVLILLDLPTFPGTLIEVQPVAVLHMIDGGEGDDKIIGVPVHDRRAKEINDLDDLSEALQIEISHFFEVYKKPEGKDVEVNGFSDAVRAKEIVQESMDRYREKFS